MFSPLWKHGLGLIIKLSEAGSKGTEAWGAEIMELSSESLTTCHRPLILAPFLRGLGLCEPWGAQEAGGDRLSPPPGTQGSGYSPCQQGTGCERAERHYLVRKGGD